MNGASEFSGTQTITGTIAGKRYTLDVLTLAEMGEQERYILSLKPNPLNVLATLEPLEDPPEIPIPPDVKEGPAAAQAYGVVLAKYQREKRRYDQLVAQRARIEKQAWQQSLLPQVVSFEDAAYFEQSLHGIAYSLFRALRRNHPEINGIEAALALIDRHGGKNISEIINLLRGLDEGDKLKNSNGPEGDRAEADDSPGPGSTPISPDDTTGHLTQSGV